MRNLHPLPTAYPAQSVETPVFVGARNSHTVLDSSPIAWLRLDANGFLLGLNRSANTLLLLQDGVCLRGGQVAPIDPWKRRLFLELLTSVQGGPPGKPHSALLLERAIDGPPLQVIFTPLEKANVPTFSSEILVHLIDLNKVYEVPERILKQLYQFTIAEAEIANSLLRGFSLCELALIRGVSVATVRSQMKTLFGKTRTKRQVDLLRVLLTLAREFPISCA